MLCVNFLLKHSWKFFLVIFLFVLLYIFMRNHIVNYEKNTIMQFFFYAVKKNQFSTFSTIEIQVIFRQFIYRLNLNLLYNISFINIFSYWITKIYNDSFSVRKWWFHTFIGHFYGSKLARGHNSHTLYYSENHIVFKLYTNK